MAGKPPRHEAQEKLPLATAAQHLLEECRMVLPGIQTLFGFQLIVVFQPAFREKLEMPEQYLHLAAIALIVISITLTMTPAAYHRQIGTRVVTETFLRLSTRLLLWGMVPLALALSLEFYLVTQIIVDGWFARISAMVLFGFVVVFWFVMPRVRSLERRLGG